MDVNIQGKSLATYFSPYDKNLAISKLSPPYFENYLVIFFFIFANLLSPLSFCRPP